MAKTSQKKNLIEGLRNKMEKIFVKLTNGYVTILNERGFATGNHLNGCDWVNVQVNGDTIMATKKDGTIQFFDSRGNYKGRA
jgi:hypothetical protein